MRQPQSIKDDTHKSRAHRGIISVYSAVSPLSACSAVNPGPMTAKTIMVQGTGSSVGKSLMATALCRIFRRQGYRVAPFKAQNMSLNSYVTPDGAEIGRSQAVQAEAAEVPPSADMNPVLLKPEVDYRSQLVVMGRPVGQLESKNFNRRKEGLWEVVAGALDRLRASFDVVVIEGAGSPAEINLRQGDIVNMEVALHAESPVLLVGDIDKGGVFASLYGTVELLAPEERELVRGFVVNKFRGDVSILRPGLRQLEEMTGVPVLGVVPYLRDLYVPEEDSPSARNTDRPSQALLDVAVIALPHISNFDDFDPLDREPGVAVRYVRTRGQLGDLHLIVVPGTKTTVADLGHVRYTGIATELARLAARGVPVIGICGGYQMLGRWVVDRNRVESDQERVVGLGLLPVGTEFVSHKQTHQVSGQVVADRGLLAGADGLSFAGYEIHMGTTAPIADGERRGRAQPGDNPAASPLRLTERSGGRTSKDDGSLSADGWVMGTYVHGLFHNTELRRALLRNVAGRVGVALPLSSGDDFSQSREYDRLADLVSSALDMDAVCRIAGLVAPDASRR